MQDEYQISKEVAAQAKDSKKEKKKGKKVESKKNKITDSDQTSG